MAKQSDLQDINQTQDIWVTDVPYTGSNTFNSQPRCMGQADIVKKKMGADNIGTSDRDLTCEEDDFNAFSIETGPDAGSGTTHPEIDSDQEDIAVSKILQAASFGRTFTTTPIVITGYVGTEVKGKKTSAANRTTTGCDVAGEAIEYLDWVAIDPGFWESS